MASKEVWAIDIDDVLLGYGAGFAKFNNRVGWTNGLRPEDYSEDWAKLWGVDDPSETTRRTYVMNRAMNPFLRPIYNAQVAIGALSKKYELIILTSRPKTIHKITQGSIDEHFKGLFSGIEYLEGGWGARGATRKAKGETAVQMGATTLVDDQPRHAIGMARAGGVGLLFGNGSLSNELEPEDRLFKAPTWADILEYAGIDSNAVLGPESLSQN